MSVREILRKGWCPSAHLPMQTGDGLLLRVKPRAGCFSIDALKAIADAAGRFGSGEIDLTNRANLQLRGLRSVTYGEALARLDHAGLIDTQAEIEAVRNIVVDPLSGIDPARRDVRNDAIDIEMRLAANPTLWTLPDKFGVSLSGGSSPRVGGRSADIMVFGDGDVLAIALDGDDVGCGLAGNSTIAESVERLLYVFLALRTNDPGIRRMRDAVGRCGLAAILQAGGLRRSQLPARIGGDGHAVAGLIYRDEKTIAACVGIPFGRVTADQLARLCDIAGDLGITSVRPGAGRVFVFPSGETQAEEILARAGEIGLITSPSDIRLAMDVCPGAPACANATTRTRADALLLARALISLPAPVASIHVSGCEKGCARREAAAITFVGRNGKYDVVRHGTAADAALLTGLRPEQLNEAAAQIAASTVS